MEPATIKAFSEALNAGGVDWEFMAYGNAVHSFTNPAAGDDPSVGAAYHPVAAARSWNLMRLFFLDVFGG